MDAKGEELALESHAVRTTAHVLTTLEGIHALTAWRVYNQGALVEQRIEELNQLGRRDGRATTLQLTIR